MRLLPDLEVNIMPHGLGLQIRGSKHPYIIRGQRAAQAWTFLESELSRHHSLDAIAESTPAAIKDPVSSLLQILNRHGLLTLGETQDPLPQDVLSSQSLFWARHGVEISDQASTGTLVLVATGLLGAVTYDLLTRSGLQQVVVLAPQGDRLIEQAVDASRLEIELLWFTEANASDLFISSIKECDLVISALRQPPLALIELINRLCLEESRILVSCREESGNYEIGPVVYPHRTACLTCLEMRRRSRDPFAVENYFYQASRVDPGGGAQGELLPMATIAAGMVNIEVSRILLGQEAELRDTVLEIDWSLRPKRHPVLRVPRCPSCYTGRQVDVPHG